MFVPKVSAGVTPIGVVYNHPDWAATTACGRVDRVPLTRYQAFMQALEKDESYPLTEDEAAIVVLKAKQIAFEKLANASAASGSGACVIGRPITR